MIGSPTGCGRAAGGGSPGCRTARHRALRPSAAAGLAFWSQLDTARRHAEVDGCRVDLYRLAAFLHGLPLRVGGVLHGCTRLSQTKFSQNSKLSCE